MAKWHRLHVCRVHGRGYRYWKQRARDGESGLCQFIGNVNMMALQSDLLRIKNVLADNKLHTDAKKREAAENIAVSHVPAIKIRWPCSNRQSAPAMSV